VATVLATEDILWFDIAMGNAMLMAILDGRKHLEERIANLVLLGAVIVGSDSREEIAAAVEVEDEEISGEAVDAVVAKADV
jgi:hypothetical protein